MTDDRRSENTTKFDRLHGDTRIFGKRPHLSKEGREIANMTAKRIRRTDPDCIDGDIQLRDILKFLDTENETKELTGELIVDLLSDGLTAKEAIVWYLYEEAGLTLREIHLAFTGRNRSFRADRARQHERNYKAILSTAGEKLGVDVDLDVENADDVEPN
jgi:hypothetical protein